MVLLTAFRLSACGPARWWQGIGGGEASNGTSKSSGSRTKISLVAGTQGYHKIRRVSRRMSVWLNSGASATVGSQGCSIAFFGASST